jgi:hypothetical protein
MKPEEFEVLVMMMTGTPVKEVTDSDRQALAVALADDCRPIDWSQFNEMLLVVNKNRVESPFFRTFFATSADPNDPSECRIADLAKGVENFQKAAMLRFGNFIYAYRRLSKCGSLEELRAELGDLCEGAEQRVAAYKLRRAKVIDVEPISRDETYLIGYLSAAEVVAEFGRGRKVLETVSGTIKSWEELDKELGKVGAPNEGDALRTLVGSLQGRLANGAGLGELLEPLRRDFGQLEMLHGRLQSVQERGIRNTDVYLSWDHMDIYFATSMRKRWEYEDLFDFVSALMTRPELQELNIRFFDPTQSFDKNRINKGLVEALMLKRALCTVYSVQDTDTLGKDSELAATLAQGKPVIAYAPKINPDERVKELHNQRPRALRDRLQFVIYADEIFTSSFRLEMSFLEEFVKKLDAFEAGMPWKSLSDASSMDKFRESNRAELERFCRVIALSEERIYNKRAGTLLNSHPLGIQVNLDTGVANGVLVVRDVETCATLVRQILTNSMEFTVEHSRELECWLLREKLTKSIYRVVTNDRKLTNCFWNFYRPSSTKGGNQA